MGHLEAEPETETVVVQRGKTYLDGETVGSVEIPKIIGHAPSAVTYNGQRYRLSYYQIGGRGSRYYFIDISRSPLKGWAKFWDNLNREVL